MDLYIQIVDGKPKDHPIVEENFRVEFSTLSPSELVTKFAKFYRTERPQGLELYQTFDTTYEWDGGVVREVHTVRDMTDEEKEAKQKAAKDIWASNHDANNFSAWTFDANTCGYVPPVPPDPSIVANTSNTMIMWSGSENKWKTANNAPTDGKPYKFDYSTWSWVEWVPPPPPSANSEPIAPPK